MVVTKATFRRLDQVQEPKTCQKQVPLSLPNSGNDVNTKEQAGRAAQQII